MPQRPGPRVGPRVETYLSRAGKELDKQGNSLNAAYCEPRNISSVPPNVSRTNNITPYKATALHNDSFVSPPYPSIGSSDDHPAGAVADDREDLNVSGGGLEGLLDKVPQTVWQPNAVVRPHRRKANIYWALLLVGYTVYIFLAISDSFERRKSPPMTLKLIDEPFQLPDVGFCFEGDTYGSRFGCFDGDADGKACAASLQGDVFVYGYNRTGYTTPDGYDESNEFVVLLPESLSDTCAMFPLSTLTAKESEYEAAWRFHMLMFWNSFYNSTANLGAFESIRMYLYREGLTVEEVIKTPITLYPPISFDPTEVPFVRGFLEYGQQLLLSGETKHTYKVVDTTTTPWHNAEDATDLAADYGTDTLASIQLDIRTQSYNQYSEVDPLDIVGTLGEITGFWLVVPLLFGLLFYRPENRDDDQAKMRSFSVCSRRTTTAVPSPDAP